MEKLQFFICENHPSILSHRIAVSQIELRKPTEPNTMGGQYWLNF